MTRRSLLAALVLITFASSFYAGDWPQFRGPNRDDVSKETGLLKSWPADGPPLAWQAKDLGDGYSSVSVVGDRVYTLGNKEKTSKVVALERDGGKPVSSAELGPAGGNLGRTPTVDGDRVVALGQDGCLP